jgi:serine/threonine protein phosphatase PrpC
MATVGKATNTGIKRRESPNQDSIGVFLPSFIHRHPPLLVVADGMGGYEGGAIASKLVIEAMRTEFMRAKPQEDYCGILRTGIFAAHNAVQNRSQNDPELAKMGSTVVAAIIHGQTLCVGNVGDSRAYVVNPQKIRLVSWDHSFVGEQVRQGIITAEESQVHPRRNILTMSLSAQRAEINPYSARIELNKEDIIVLCSDGLWGPVSEDQIQAVVLDLAPQQAADKLVEMANDNEGPDNISVIIARQ